MGIFFFIMGIFIQFIFVQICYHSFRGNTQEYNCYVLLQVYIQAQEKLPDYFLDQLQVLPFISLVGRYESSLCSISLPIFIVSSCNFSPSSVYIMIECYGFLLNFSADYAFFHILSHLYIFCKMSSQILCLQF